MAATACLDWDSDLTVVVERLTEVSESGPQHPQYILLNLSIGCVTIVNREMNAI